MIVLDIEASGVDPKIYSIVSLGALILEEPERQIYEECRIWDGAHVDPEALAVNGFSEEEIRDSKKQTEAELIQKFTQWAVDGAEDRTFAGQNVSFDRDYVLEASHRAGIEYSFSFRTIDTHTLAYMHMVLHGLTPPIAKNHSALNLDAILNYCGIPSEPQPHNALTGALSHAEVISRLLYNKKLLPEFEQYDIPWK